VTVQDEDQAPHAMVAGSHPPHPRPARSVAEAAPGEMIYIDRRAEVIGPRRLLAMKVGGWTMLGGTVLASGILYGFWFSPLVGVAVAGAVGGFAWFRLRHWPAFRTAIALMAAYRWEEGHAALLALERKSLSASWRRQVQIGLAALEVLLGQPETALGRLDRAREQLRGSSRGYAMLTRWRAASIRAGVLARLGRLDEARQQRDELVAEIAAWEKRRGRPRGEILDIYVQSAQLTVAFEADAPGELPDDETLHKWARAALARTKFGELLVGLAWAFHRRGDSDMALHLLAESASRIVRPSLPVTAPRLHAWAEEQRGISGP
jgi:hypothetical protein